MLSCVSVVGVNLHANEIARSAPGSDASGPVMPCLMCASAASCVAAVVSARFVLLHVWALVQNSLTDICVFARSVLLVLQAGLYVTPAVRRRVKQILSNKVFVSSSSLRLARERASHILPM